MANRTLKITEIAAAANVAVGERGANWAPTDLPAAFRAVEAERVGRGEVALLDGAGPTWAIACIAHACHPGDAYVNYPQGACTLRVTGWPVEGLGQAEDVTFTVTDGGDHTLVEFGLNSPNLDLPKAMAGFIAPAVPHGKPVRITGRGPVAIATALATAYAHLVPEVAMFQPGVGYVVALSHCNTPLGTVYPA